MKKLAAKKLDLAFYFLYKGQNSALLVELAVLKNFSAKGQ